jgi:hypothetical protein
VSSSDTSVCLTYLSSTSTYDANQKCEPCSLGKYQPSSAAGSCLWCPSTKYQDGKVFGAPVTCKTCPDGTKNRFSGACNTCPGGSYLFTVEGGRNAISPLCLIIFRPL